MTIQIWIRITAAIVVITTVLAIFVAWRAETRDRSALAAELAATRQVLQAADANQRERDTKLADTLSAIKVQKRTVQSPSQIVTDLPNQMQLPVGITLQNVPQPATASGIKNARIDVGATSGGGQLTSGFPSAKGAANPNGQDVSKVQAVIPGQDLKALYDFALDCKACQAKLTASQSDLADERGKTKALTKERDDALRVARGGSILRRLARASKWMLIGAAAGAAAARAIH